MKELDLILSWVMKIGGAVVVLAGALFWIRVALKGRSTARSFMALVFTFVLFISAVLSRGELDERVLIWLIVTFAGVLAVYIIARMVEHREEIRMGLTKTVKMEDIEVQPDAVQNAGQSGLPGPRRSIILDKISGESSIDASEIDIEITTRGLFQKRRVIHIIGTANSEEAKRKVTEIARQHAGDDYLVVNDLHVED